MGRVKVVTVVYFVAFTITMSKSIGNLSYVLPNLQKRRNHCIYFCLAMMQKVLNVLSSWQKIFWIQLVPSLVHLGNQILAMLVYKINWGCAKNKKPVFQLYSFH